MWEINIDIEAQMIADISLKVYVISFSQDKMTLRVPVNRASAVGLRTLINKNDIHEVYAILQENLKRGKQDVE